MRATPDTSSRSTIPPRTGKWSGFSARVYSRIGKDISSWFAGLLAIVLFSLLSACVQDGRFGNVTGGFGSLSTRVKLSGETIIVEGPPGFCVDKQASEIGTDAAFLLLGNCAVVLPSLKKAEPKVKALLTATISAPEQGSSSVAEAVQSMDKFFRSENGRTALSRSSDPGTVEVLDTFHKDGIFYLRARDTSAGIVPGAAPDYWRAYFDLRGQLVSVSVIGFVNSPLEPEVALRTLQEFAFILRGKNS